MGRSIQHAKFRHRRVTRGFWTRSVGIVLSSVALTLFAGGASVAYADASTSATPTQKAEAIMKPSLVYIQIQAKGWILGNTLGEVLATLNGGQAPPLTANASCSGAVVSPAGDILTAGHCVDPQSVQGGLKGMIIDEGISTLQQTGVFTSDELAALRSDALANGRVEGQDAGSPPDSTFTVYPASQASGAPDPKGGLPASVVSVKSFKDGDVALLKAEPSFKLPALQVAPGEPESGASIVAAGYPGAVTGNVDIVHLAPTLSPGDVGQAQSVEGTPVTQISANTSQGMSGGPVVDTQGRIVGTVSWGVTGPNKVTFNFMTNTNIVKAVLSGASVSNSLSKPDQDYRTGLNQYFDGQHHAAAATFQQVLDIEPNQPGAQYYKAQAIQNYPNEKSSNAWLWILIGVVAVLLIGGGTAFYLVRRGKKGAPSPAAPVEVPTAVTPTAPAPSAPATTAAVPPVAAPTAMTPPVPPPTAEPQPAPAEPATPVSEPATPVAEPVGAPAHPDGHPAGGDGHAGNGQAREAAGEGAAPAAAAQKQVFCPNCGTPHDPSSHFCVSCGTHFEETGTPPAARR